MNPVVTCPPVTWQAVPFAALTLAQLYAMLHLRQQVFVVEQRCIYLDADGRDPHCHHCWGSSSEGHLVASARLEPPGHAFEGPNIGRVIVAPAWRAHGQGRALMAQMITLSQAQYPGQAVWLSAQAHLQAFYASLGFTPQSEPYDDEGIAHVDMRRDMSTVR